MLQGGARLVQMLVVVVAARRDVFSVPEDPLPRLDVGARFREPRRGRVTPGMYRVPFSDDAGEIQHFAEGEPGILLLGSLSTAFGSVVNYYLGSSLGSALKEQYKQRGGR